MTMLTVAGDGDGVTLARLRVILAAAEAQGAPQNALVQAGVGEQYDGVVVVW